MRQYVEISLSLYLLLSLLLGISNPAQSCSNFVSPHPSVLLISQRIMFPILAFGFRRVLDRSIANARLCCLPLQYLHKQSAFWVPIFGDSFCKNRTEDFLAFIKFWVFYSPLSRLKQLSRVLHLSSCCSLIISSIISVNGFICSFWEFTSSILLI